MKDVDDNKLLRLVVLSLDRCLNQTLAAKAVRAENKYNVFCNDKVLKTLSRHIQVDYEKEEKRAERRQ